jgi:uncharacterized membrane protein YcaP (DUF421 family)
MEGVFSWQNRVEHPRWRGVALMDSIYTHMALELVIGLFALFAAMKLLGKRKIKQLTPFDFISAIVLSELLGNALYAHETKITHILFALGFWTALLLIIEKLGLRYRMFGNILDGKPSIIIRRGLLDHAEMRRNKLSIHELQSLLRQAGHFSVREIEFAIFENNGAISVLPKSKEQPPKEVHIPYTLIADGELIEENLQEIGLTRQWLEEELKSQGYSTVKDIFLADWVPDDGLYVVPYREE